MLDDVKRRIRDVGIEIEFSDGVTALLAKEGFDAVYGARPLRRAVVRLIEEAISTELLEGRIARGSAVIATVEDGKIVFAAK